MVHVVHFSFTRSRSDKVVQVVFGGLGWSQLCELDGTCLWCFWLD